MRGDNAQLRAIDEALEWVDDAGNSPALTAERLGVAGHIIRGIGVVWEDGGIWSYCVLNKYSIGTTLLARSKAGLVRLHTTLCARVTNESEAKRWQPYYSALWKRRYKKWCCSGKRACDCQLCRGGRAKVKP